MAKHDRSRFNIEVTPGDIEKAQVGDSFQCVVAQAIKRQIPEARKIDVDARTVRWSDDGGRHVFLTPYTVAGYVIAFDAGDDLHPFRFQLRDPIPALQKQAKTPASKDTKRTRNKVTSERQRVKAAERVLADEAAPPERKAIAREVVAAGPSRIEEARRVHEDVKAAYQAAGESTGETRTTETTHRVPVTTRRREYGQRVLRVNQAPGRKHVIGRMS